MLAIFGGFLQKALREEGYLVDVIATGDDGFALAGSASFDCIVLDLMLPGMGGLTVVRESRRQ